MLECGLRAVVLHDKGVVWNYYAECTADSRRINTNAKKGVINKEHITTLSSPAQLTHAGFYSFAACSADVNSQVDEDSMKFTSYATGDFYAFLLGDQMTASGCRFGTLIITSPRFAGTFWIARIWERKFAGWFELCTK